MKSLGRSRFFSVYGASFIITGALIALVGIGMGPTALLTLLMLTVIEVTFSLDCAVINAQVLKGMSVFWRHMFRTVGIFIAVFGMRLLLPLSIVAVSAGLSFGEVTLLALQHPEEYAQKLHAANPYIAMLGGTFLLMVFLEFLLGHAKDNPFSGIVRHLHMRGAKRYVQIGIVFCFMAAVVFSADIAVQLSLFISGMTGIVLYVVARAFAGWFAVRHTAQGRTARAVARGGLVAFLYLEMLDASFSFDSVIGAFAITNNIVLIVVGLGIGAVWVRSLTIDLLQKGTLTHYSYVGLGANIAIGALGILLLIEVNVPVPELLTGSVGLLIIIASVLASVIHNRRAAKSGALTRITLHSHLQ